MVDLHRRRENIKIWDTSCSRSKDHRSACEVGIKLRNCSVCHRGAGGEETQNLYLWDKCNLHIFLTFVTVLYYWIFDIFRVPIKSLSFTTLNCLLSLLWHTINNPIALTGIKKVNWQTYLTNTNKTVSSAKRQLCKALVSNSRPQGSVFDIFSN